MTRPKCALVLLACTALLGIAGCSSSDSPTASSNSSGVSFTNYYQLVESVAPPLYASAAVSPSAIDSMWNTGDFQLLDKVFGADEPTSLYRNVEDFSDNVLLLEDLLKVDDSGNYFADSAWMSVYKLASAVPIPLRLQPIFGQSVDVDQYVSVAFPDAPEGWLLHIGFKETATEEVILAWMTMPAFGAVSGMESSIYYAHLNKLDSTFSIKGAAVEHAGADTASWAYDISSTEMGDFRYRMSWYSDEIPDNGTLLGCIVGGGNKDDEFALKYRQCIPADSPSYDTLWQSEQVFGPDYSEGASLISSFNEYVDDSLMFTYSEVPRYLLVTPFQN